jgi:Na+/proline symporter
MVIIFVTYISVAGLWASIFADTIMSLVMYIAILVLTSAAALGLFAGIGLGGYWDGLYNAMASHPVLQPAQAEAVWESQWDGLNWLNTAGIGFLIVNTIGNLGAVLCNQTYWSRGIGSDNPKNIYKSFWTGAWGWFPIPLAMTTALGLGALAKGLVVGEVYISPWNNVAITFTEAEAAAPVMAFLTVGYLGLALFVIAVTGATVSTGAGEILSTASVFANDIYKGWLKPEATSKQIVAVNRVALYIIAATLYGIAAWWRAIGFSFSGMYQAMGVAFSSAVVPLWMAIFYRTTNRSGVFWGTIIGAIVGIAYWVVIADFDLLWGVVWANIIVMAVSAIIVIPWTIVKPEPFDFRTLHDAGYPYEEVSIVGHKD